MSNLLTSPRLPIPPTPLVGREREIALVASHPNRAIAETLFLNVRTVENHGVRTRTSAVTAAIAGGFVDPASASA